MRLVPAIFVLLPFALSGCVPVAVPPMQARISGGPTDSAHAVVEWRAGLHPAQLLESQFRRPWVVGAGYVGRHVGLLGLGHGLYGELGYAHVGPRRAERSLRRLTFTVAPEMIYRAGYDAWGYGGTASVGLEWVKVVRSSDGPGGDHLAAVAHGEGGVGVNLSGGFERVDDRDVGFVLVGLRLSVPAFAGLIFTPDLLMGVLRNL